MSFILADFALRSMMGHPFAYDMSVKHAAVAAGWERIHVLSNVRAEPMIIDRLSAEPALRCDIDDNFVTSRFRRTPHRHERINMTAHHKRSLADLRSASRYVLERERDNLALFPTVRHSQLRPIFQWVKEANKKCHLECSIVLHFTALPNFETDSYRGDHYRHAFSYLEKSPVRNRIRLFADSQELIDEYRDYTTHPIELAPVPHAAVEKDSEISTAADRLPDSACRLVYLGDARNNKGFHLLGPLLNALREELASGKISAEIQSNVRNSAEIQSRWSVEQLRKLPNILLHESTLSPLEYGQLLERADIVLAPYTLEYYHSQTSGVVSEAIAAGKPVIVPKGTWSAREARKYHAGLVEFNPSDATSLREAVLWAVEHLDLLKARGHAAAPKWQAFHNFTTYFDIISGAL